MPYRQPAEAPKAAPRPVERLSVSRYGLAAGIAIVVAAVALASVFASWFYASTALVCTRASAGAAARCVPSQRLGLTSTDMKPFELRESSVSIAEREWDDSMHVVIATPSGELRGGVDRPFAEATTAGARRFAGDPNALRWEASVRNTGTMAIVIAGALVFVVAIVLIVTPTKIAVDRDAGVVRVGRRREFRLIEIDDARVEDIDDSAFHKVVLVLKDTARRTIAVGRKRECSAVASSVRSAARELAPKERTEDREEKTEPSDEEKWQRAEAMLRALPLEGNTVVRDTESRDVEARGTRRGFSVRVWIDPMSSETVEIEVAAQSNIAMVEAQYDRRAKPDDAKNPKRIFFGEGIFTDDEEEAVVLRAMPATLRAKILAQMGRDAIQTLGVWETEVCVSSAATHDIDAMIDLAVDVAEYASIRPG